MVGLAVEIEADETVCCGVGVIITSDVCVTEEVEIKGGGVADEV